MTINIVLIAIFLLLIMTMILIVISLNSIKYNKELESNLHINDYIFSSNVLLLLILIALYNILLFTTLSSILPNYAAYLITAFGGNSLIALIGILPIINVANKHPNKVTNILKYFILLISYLLLPFSYIYVSLRNSFFKPSIVKMTEDEFLDIIEKAEQSDGINESEKDLIKSVLDFDDLKVLDIYTPRIDIVAVEESMDYDEITSKFINSGLSRLPVYTKKIDNIVGTVNFKDFYNKVLLEKAPFESVIIKPVEVTEYMPAKSLLTLLKTSNSHMAIVKDEYGGTLGVVTMEDILEELVGDIYDEHDKITTNIKKINDYKYLVKGQAYLDELEDVLNITTLEDEDYLTVNGWVLANLGKMGKPGDTFTYENNEIIVKKANSKMILEVEINLKEKKDS